MKPPVLALIAVLVIAGPLAAQPAGGAAIVLPIRTAGDSQGASAKRQPSTLDALVSELDRSNPELKAARREVDMRVARIAPAGAPPDPSLTFGYMGGLLRPPFFPSSSTADGFRQFGASHYTLEWSGQYEYMMRAAER